MHPWPKGSLMPRSWWFIQCGWSFKPFFSVPWAKPNNHFNMQLQFEGQVWNMYQNIRLYAYNVFRTWNYLWREYWKREKSWLKSLLCAELCLLLWWLLHWRTSNTICHMYGTRNWIIYFCSLYGVLVGDLRISQWEQSFLTDEVPLCRPCGGRMVTWRGRSLITWIMDGWMDGWKNWDMTSFRIQNCNVRMII